MKLPTVILAATDFSERATAAVEYAVDLAAQLGAKLHIVTAVSMPAAGIPEIGLAISATMAEATVRKTQDALDALVARFAPSKLATIGKTMSVGDPRDVILTAAEDVFADLIVVGTHGRRGVRRALLGSIAETVVRHAICPVLVVR